jgi:hypothetical protein
MRLMRSPFRHAEIRGHRVVAERAVALSRLGKHPPVTVAFGCGGTDLPPTSAHRSASALHRDLVNRAKELSGTCELFALSLQHPANYRSEVGAAVPSRRVQRAVYSFKQRLLTGDPPLKSRNLFAGAEKHRMTIALKAVEKSRGQAKKNPRGGYPPGLFPGALSGTMCRW